MTAWLTRRFDRGVVVGLVVVAVSARHLLARGPRLRCRPGRLLLPRRRVPPRPDVARLPARAVRRDHRRRAVLRAVRAVPGRRAACRSSRSSGRSTRTRSSRGSTRSSRPAGVGLCWMLLGRIGVRSAVRPAGADDPVRVLDADPVGHDPRRRLAHGAADRDDPDASPASSSCGAGSGRGSSACSPGAAFLTRAPLAFAIPFYALMLEPRRRVPAEPRSPAATSRRSSARAAPRRGSGSGSASCRRSSRSSPTTRSGSGRRWSRATRWRRCPPFLEAQRALGLFSLAHVPMNLDYFLLHLPTVDPGLPVLPARRPGPVGADHQPGPAVRDARPTGDGRAPGGCSARPSPSSSRRSSTTAAAGSSTATATSSIRCRS